MSKIKRADFTPYGMVEKDEGHYVYFSDHEAEVARLRAEIEENENVINVWRGRTQRAEAEVEAYRKDAIRWDWLMNDYHGGNVARANKVLAGCWNRSQMEEAIDKDLAERDQAAMGASA
jgi:hypothetical protein